MNKQPNLSDYARQFATIFGAIFQVYTSYLTGDSVGTIAREFHSLILPAGYAFAIWGPIFFLCAVYALYQALPTERANRVFRAIGWWTAGAFLANGLWTSVYTNRQFVLAQIVIFVGLAFAAGAYILFTREVSATDATSIQNRLVGPTLGLLFGWLTAASVVGLAGTFVALGFAPTGSGAEIRGVALLLIAGAVAAFVIVRSRQGSTGAWLSYGTAVLWALIAVIVEQRSASLLTTGAAAVCAILVLLAAFGPWATVPTSGPQAGSA